MLSTSIFEKRTRIAKIKMNHQNETRNTPKKNNPKKGTEETQDRIRVELNLMIDLLIN